MANMFPKYLIETVVIIGIMSYASVVLPPPDEPIKATDFPFGIVTTTSFNT